MLLIRAQQEARLNEGARVNFLDRVERHVVSKDPKRAGKFDPSELRQFVERNWEAARSFGLTSEPALCLFLEAVCAFGEDFPITQDWAAPLLQSPGYEEIKLGGLREHLAESGARGGNGQNGHGSGRS